MTLRGRNILGLAISDRGISCAQVAVSPRRKLVQRLAYFALPDSGTFDDAESIGRSLRAFLRQKGFTARTAVIGVPARWLIAQEKELPPADPQQAQSILRLHAERLAVADSAAMVFDYAGAPDPAKPARVLLVGMLQQQLDRIERLCAAAGLVPLTVTGTTIAFAHALGRRDDAPLVLHSRQGAEIIWQTGGAPQMLRHLACGASAAGGSAVAVLGGELRRALTLISADERAHGEMVMWDETGLSAADLGELSRRVGMTVQTGTDLRSLHTEIDAAALNGEADRASPQQFLPAVAVALCGIGRGEVPVDFLHRRLATPRQSRIGRGALLGAAAAVLGLVLVGLLYASVLQAEAEADVLDAHLLELKEDIAAAEARIGRMRYGQGYFDTRPQALECLREVTLAFPATEPIWTTSFTLRDGRRGQLQGKAIDQRTVLELLDRIKSNGNFSDVQLQDMREGTGTTREIAFSITFTFITAGQ